MPGSAVTLHPYLRRWGRRAGSVAVLSAFGVGAGVFGATNLWAQEDDGSESGPLDVPVGRRGFVETPDGATISVKIVEPSTSETPSAVLPGGDGSIDLRATSPITVVLSHCWTGDHRVWGQVASRLVGVGHRVVLYDQRGHGDSSVGRQGCTISASGSDLRCVVEHVDADNVIVAGHSMGGMSAQAYAIEHPESFRSRVVGLALVSTASSGISEGRGPTARVIGTLVGTAVAQRALARPRLGPFMVRRAVGSSPSLADLSAVCETFVATEPRARLGFFDAMEAMDFHSGLAGIEVPTVVVCGTRDWLTPQRHSRRLVLALPNAWLELIRGGGHMLPLEEPQLIFGMIDDLATRVRAREAVAHSPSRD